MPRPVQHSRKGKMKEKPPQKKIDEFWEEFTTQAPGKVTNIIPHNVYAVKASKRISARRCVGVGGKTTQASYEEAAAACVAKVEKIVRECRRINQKYRDPHFDLELDLKTRRRDCLESLSNDPDDYESDEGSDSDVSAHPSAGYSSRRRNATAGAGEARLGGAAKAATTGQKGKSSPSTAHTTGDAVNSLTPSSSSPRGRDPSSKLNPRAVKRVGEIFDYPQLYIDGATANDVRQGRDGDCWLMAALCVLSNKPGLIEKICVAHDQDVGVYGFVFHRDGEWFSEIIDDKLYLTKPDYDEVHMERILWEDRDRINSEEAYRKTYQCNSGALYFAQCEDPNETWLPLLEKAYAKAHGDYAAIEGGFTGEGIEDLTGGVTSELTTTDILDKEYFWNEELMKVNEQFLFGCSTGLWGNGWGDRAGIKEGHAYSIMRAVEMDGERLVLLKNPWGKGQWGGAWSDGSKEWTAEWLEKLNHRFGDDGVFWMSYDDLLRKYQSFDRTRLFGPDWKVNAIWTTLSIPWMLEYHPTKFSFTLTRPGPVVLVLSQLDKRYFLGLEGQYKFKLGFRLHAAGADSADDYLVRSSPVYCMSRSVNVELELEAGEYHVLVKVDARRRADVLPVEDVVRSNAVHRRDKLRRIGLAYDLAHAKGAVTETAEERAARKAWEERKRRQARDEVRRRMEQRLRWKHYYVVKAQNKRRERAERRRERRMAKMEHVWQAGNDDVKSGNGHGSSTEAVCSQRELSSESDATSSAGRTTPLTATVTGADREVTPASITAAAAPAVGKGATVEADSAGEGKEGKEVDKESSPENNKEGVAIVTTEAQQETTQATDEQNPNDEQEALNMKRLRDRDAAVEDGSEKANTRTQPAEAGSKVESPAEVKQEARAKRDEKVTRAIQLLATVKKQLEVLSDDDDDDDDGSPDAGNQAQPGPDPYTYHILLPPPALVVPPPPLDFYPSYPMGSVPALPPPPPADAPPGAQPEPPDKDDTSSVSSLSELSERELDLQMEMMSHYAAEASLPRSASSPSRRTSRTAKTAAQDDEPDGGPWNAVVVVGLRVYYRVAADDAVDAGTSDGRRGEAVKLRVLRPVRYESSDESADDGDCEQAANASTGGMTEGAAAGERAETDETKVLDLDDSAKDATLKEQEREQERATPEETGETDHV